MSKTLMVSRWLFFLCAVHWITACTQDTAPNHWGSQKVTQFSLSQMPRVIRGGIPYKIEISDVPLELKALIIYRLGYSLDGTNYSFISDLKREDRSYVWTPPAIEANKVALRVYAQDVGETVRFQISNFFDIRTKGPALSVNGALEIFTNTPSLTVSGHCEPALLIKIESAQAAVLHLPASLLCDTSGSWSLPMTPSSDGKRDIVFSQKDDADFEKVLNFSWTRDTVVPALTVVAPTAVTNATGVHTFSGLCESGLPIHFQRTPIAGMTLSTPLNCNGGQWQQTVQAVADGNYALAAKQTDAAGNLKTVAFSFTRDTSLPNFNIVSPSGNIRDNASSLSLSGTCQNGLDITLSMVGGATAVPNFSPSCNSGAWSQTVPATTDGIRTLTGQQTNAAGGTSLPVSRVWTRDTVLPVLTTSAPSYNTRANSLSVTGTCEATRIIAISTPSASGVSVASSLGCLADGSFSLPISFSADGNYTFSLSENDGAGNVATVSFSVLRDTTAPALTLIGSGTTVTNNANSLALSGACEDGLSINLTVDGIAVSGASCASSVWSKSIASTVDGVKQIVVSQTDGAGNSTSSSRTWRRDTVKPVVDAATFLIENGASETPVNYVRTALQAADGHLITHFCLNYNTAPSTDPSTGLATGPSSSHACWRAVNARPPGLPVQSTLSLSNYYYRLGFIAGNYDVRAYVKDAAGNISNAIAPKTILYKPGHPPTLSNLRATSSEFPSTPSSVQDLTVANGDPVYIRWTAEDIDPDGLISAPIALYYTTDDSTWSLVAKDLLNGPNGCRTVDPSKPTVGPLTPTGCYLWPRSPVATGIYFRIQVRVTDRVVVNGISYPGATSFGQTNALNLNNFNFLAGNTELGLGGVATKAIFKPTGRQALVVHPSGKIFVLDTRGLMLVDPIDGNQQLYIRNGSATSVDGVISAARLRYGIELALDFQGNLLIYDYDRIRRVLLDRVPVEVETLIGGGTDSTSNPVAARDLKFLSTNPGNALFPLPNGNLYFISDQDGNGGAGGGKIRLYDSVNRQVNTIQPSGDSEISGEVGKRIEACGLQRFGLEFNEINSGITQFMTLMRPTSQTGSCSHNTTTYGEWPDYVRIGASGNPANPIINVPTQAFGAMGLYPGAREYYFYFGQAMNGKLYTFGVGAEKSNIVTRYNSTTNLWEKVLGTGTTGVCLDGTPAANCDVSLTSIFVDATDTLYFLDRGTVRTVQDGAVLTLVGERKNYGDGQNPLNARFGDISSFEVIRNAVGKDVFTLVDRAEYRIREFQEGTVITTIAGTGRNEAAAVDAAAQTSPITFGYDMDNSFISIDPLNGDLYSIRSMNKKPAKIEKTSGLWKELGLERAGGYGPRVLGQSTSSILVSTSRFCHEIPAVCDTRIFEYPKDGSSRKTVVSQVATSVVEGVFCADGQPLANCTAPRNGDSPISVTQAISDDARGLWYIMQKGSKRIVKLTSQAGAAMQTLAVLPKNANHFTYYRSSNGSKEIIYYCANDGVNKYDILTGLNSVLAFPVASMSCGYTGAFVYSEARNSLIFNYRFQEMPGIAEFLNP